MTTDCIPAKFSCPTPRGARPGRIEADFSGGAITSHAGLLLAGLAEGRLGLFSRVAACFDDVRCPELVVHEVRSLVGQRILGLLSGLEDPCLLARFLWVSGTMLPVVVHMRSGVPLCRHLRPVTGETCSS